MSVPIGSTWPARLGAAVGLFVPDDPADSNPPMVIALILYDRIPD